MELITNIKTYFDILSLDEIKCIEDLFEKFLKEIFLSPSEGKNEKIVKQFFSFFANMDASEIQAGNYACRLYMLPLDRVGAKMGKSGSNVFVSYLKFKSGNEVFHSQPLIVKFNVFAKSKNSYNPLKEEFEKTKEIKAVNSERFATSIWYDSIEITDQRKYHSNSHRSEFCILLSPFKPVGGSIEYEPNIEELQENNLRKEMVNITKGSAKKIKIRIKNILKALTYWHSNNQRPKRCNRSFSDEYLGYLRDVGGWKKNWEFIWGNLDSTVVYDFNTLWVNPFWLLDELLSYEAQMTVGAIHGDLHPRNIVISENSSVLIDFGWANGDAHIAKDYVMLEANFRFQSMTHKYSHEYLVNLSKSITSEEILRSPEPVLQCIGVIRNSFLIHHQNFTEGHGYNELYEYIIPLFIVSTGLLKYIEDIGNFESARLSVLELGNYINAKVIKKNRIEEKTLGEIGEFKILDILFSKIHTECPENDLIGDDCAFIELNSDSNRIVVTTDPGPKPLVMTLAGLGNYFHWGWYTILVNVSDLASTGATPQSISISIDAPVSMLLKDLLKFYDGLLAACNAFKISLSGGNLRSSKIFSAHSTAIGVIDVVQNSITRSNCNAGDLLYTIGNNGKFISLFLKAKYDGIDSLSAKEKDYITQTSCQIEHMKRLNSSNFITSASDNSDGIIGSIMNIAQASNCAFEVDFDEIRRSSNYSKLEEIAEKYSKEELRIRPENLFLFWGDWQVLLTITNEKEKDFISITENYNIPITKLGYAKKKDGENINPITGKSDGKIYNILCLRNENFISNSFHNLIRSHLDFMLSENIFLGERKE